jgi:hypothetical protein
VSHLISGIIIHLSIEYKNKSIHLFDIQLSLPVIRNRKHLLGMEEIGVTHSLTQSH